MDKDRRTFRVIRFSYAGPLHPEFAYGDPVIVWKYQGLECIRIVHSVAEDNSINCLNQGALLGTRYTPWPYYRPLQQYDYGGRRVWGRDEKYEVIDSTNGDKIMNPEFIASSGPVPKSPQSDLEDCMQELREAEDYIRELEDAKGPGVG
jgi:hypothetical protein